MLSKDHIPTFYVCLIEEGILSIHTLVELINLFMDGHDEFTVSDGWLTPGVYQSSKFILADL